MKKLLALIFTTALALFIVKAAQPAKTVTLSFQHLPNPADMAGLSTNDYYTNINAMVLSTTNITIPTNQWPAVAVIPVSPLITQQGPPGTTWTNQIQSDGLSRFYAIVMTNNNGGSSPFSNLAPALAAPTAGTLILPLKVSP